MLQGIIDFLNLEMKANIITKHLSEKTVGSVDLTEESIISVDKAELSIEMSKVAEETLVVDTKITPKGE